MEDTLEEVEILTTVHLALHLEGSEGSPGVDGRVDITEVPLVSGQLSVGVHVPFTSEEVELLLGKLRIDHGERDTVEG